MKPVDFRNETFEQVRARIVEDRAAVLAAWCMHGPGTTAEVAARSGLSILNLRPRTTELCELGFVVVDESGKAKGERRKSSGAIYRAATPAEAAAHFRRAQLAALNPQAELSLT